MTYWQQLINEVVEKNSKANVYTKSTNDLECPDKNKLKRKLRRYYLGNDMNHLYLTHREAGCVFYILQGYTMKETARELDLSPRTVEFYFKRIKEKFGCRSRSDLIKIFMKNDVLGTLKKVDLN
ncbi:MAG: helix-turn-helix transcriptional regulator [Pseudomonadota bacterium]|nr:helix-turn-helix transcriptional regulator [Pseudomonadota bacterium]